MVGEVESFTLAMDIYVADAVADAFVASISRLPLLTPLNILYFIAPNRSFLRNLHHLEILNVITDDCFPEILVHLSARCPLEVLTMVMYSSNFARYSCGQVPDDVFLKGHILTPSPQGTTSAVHPSFSPWTKFSAYYIYRRHQTLGRKQMVVWDRAANMFPVNSSQIWNTPLLKA